MSGNIKDTAIIGAGVAGAFASLRFAEKYPDAKAILFELGTRPQKRKRQLEGWLGCFPAGDGKLYINDFEKVHDLVDGRKVKPIQKLILDLFGEAGPIKLTKDTHPNVAAQKKLKEAGFEIKCNDHIQWKPDSIHQLSRNISEAIDSVGNVEFSFDNEVHRIFKKKGVFHINTENGDFAAKNLILCVGRSGWRWATKLYKELGLAVNDDHAKFGVRVEISSQYLKDFNRSHCTLTKDNLEIGPLSWSGTIIPEDHADLVIAAFRSNEERWKSDKVSFSLIESRTFKDTGCYQTDRLAKLAYLLFNDRVSKERIKIFMKNASQLSLLPEYNWLTARFNELDSLIPNLINKGSFHVPNIMPVASSIRLGTNLETEMDGLFVAGESAGITGILAAATMGTIAADSSCK